MNAETRAALDDLTARLAAVEERLVAIDARLDRGRARMLGHDEQLRTLRQDAVVDRRQSGLRRDVITAEIDALEAEVNMITATIAQLRERMNDAQRPRPARKIARRRADPDD